MHIVFVCGFDDAHTFKAFSYFLFLFPFYNSLLSEQSTEKQQTQERGSQLTNQTSKAEEETQLFWIKSGNIPGFT